MYPKSQSHVCKLANAEINADKSTYNAFKTKIAFLPVSNSKYYSLSRSILQNLHHFITAVTSQSFTINL